MPQILIVDDDRSVQMALEMILADEGMQVDKADDGESALELIYQRKYDLVLADLRMPNMNGLELLKTIRKQWGRSLPMIFISAYASDEVTDQALKAGISDFIIKPFDVQGVVKSVKCALGAA